VTAFLGMSSAPTFLVGSPRSGTTLLRLMLDHHPRIAFFSEMQFIVNPLPDCEGFITVEQFRGYAETDYFFRESGFRIGDGVESYEEMARHFLEQFRQRRDKPLVGATVHEHFDRLLRIWPEAKLIHIVRDPRDVARSIAQMGGWAGTPWGSARLWIEAETLWDRLRPALPEDRTTDVAYEQLVAVPEGTLTRLAAFMGMPYDPAMLSYPDDTTYDPPTASLANQWKTKMPERDVQLVEARVGGLLAARGYAPSGLPPVTITPEIEAQLRRQDTSARRRFRRKRYGLALWTADLLTRRLRLRGLQKKVRRALDEVDRRYIK
jgi:hypothetical protein